MGVKVEDRLPSCCCKCLGHMRSRSLSLAFGSRPCARLSMWAGAWRPLALWVCVGDGDCGAVGCGWGVCDCLCGQGPAAPRPGGDSEPANCPLSLRHYVVRGPEMTPYEGKSAPRWRGVGWGLGGRSAVLSGGLAFTHPCVQTPHPHTPCVYKLDWMRPDRILASCRPWGVCSEFT